MNTKKKKKIRDMRDMPKRIKVKLDERTTIMINRPESLAVWKRIYPNAIVIGGRQ